MHTEWGPWIRSMNLKGSKYEIQGGGLHVRNPIRVKMRFESSLTQLKSPITPRRYSHARIFPHRIQLPIILAISFEACSRAL